MNFRGFRDPQVRQPIFGDEKLISNRHVTSHWDTSIAMFFCWPLFTSSAIRLGRFVHAYREIQTRSLKMLGSLSKSVLSNVSKLPKLRCLGSNLYNNLTPIKRCYNENKIPTPGKEPSAKTKRRQTLDGVPLNYAVIYNSHEYHTIAQHGCTALVGSFWIVGAVHMIRNFEELFPDVWSSALNLWLASAYLFVNAGTAFITYRSPVRIYFDGDTGNYKAVFNDLIPTKIRTLDFRKGDVEHLPPGDELSLFRFARFKIKDHKLYMLEEFFRYPADLYNMFDEIEQEGEQEESGN